MKVFYDINIDTLIDWADKFCINIGNIKKENKIFHCEAKNFRVFKDNDKYRELISFIYPLFSMLNSKEYKHYLFMEDENKKYFNKIIFELKNNKYLQSFYKYNISDLLGNKVILNDEICIKGLKYFVGLPGIGYRGNRPDFVCIEGALDNIDDFQKEKRILEYIWNIVSVCKHGENEVFFNINTKIKNNYEPEFFKKNMIENNFYAEYK